MSSETDGAYFLLLQRYCYVKYSKVAVVIDYQNVHMTAREVFMPNAPAVESLIDPYLFSQQIITIKNAAVSNNPKLNLSLSELSRVEVYRGLPEEKIDPDGYRRNLLQRSAWELEAKQNNLDMTITYRPLKYYRETSKGATVPKPQEKGVDVLCALAVTRLSRSGDFDTVILASRDTDLIPALDEAHNLTKTKVEAVKWYSPKVKKTKGGLTVDKSWKLWTTSMDEDAFKVSRDISDYN